MPLVRINARRIVDWDTFHNVFAEAFGFPDFYGRNMNAWIDCMSYPDEPEDSMTTVHGGPSDPVVLHVDDIDSLSPVIYAALVECAGFVNFRNIKGLVDPPYCVSRFTALHSSDALISVASGNSLRPKQNQPPWCVRAPMAADEARILPRRLNCKAKGGSLFPSTLRLPPEINTARSKAGCPARSPADHVACSTGMRSEPPADRG
jgi:hypothetical protein